MSTMKWVERIWGNRKHEPFSGLPAVTDIVPMPKVKPPKEINMLTYNGYPVVFELSVVTEPGEGWKGSRQLAVCKTVEELTEAIRNAEVPPYWQLEVQLQEDHDRCSGCHECDND